MKRCRDYHPFIDNYIDAVRSGALVTSKELKLAMDLVERKLDDPDVFIDSAKIEKGIELIERYFKMKFLDWELFVFALIHCYYKSSDTVVFDEFFIMMGRGNGKNGFISPVAWYLTTPCHGIQGYSVDLIANSEQQAKTSFGDIYEMLERTWSKSKKFFYKSKELIQNTKTKSYIKYNTSNAKTKDGKRSAALIFDECAVYETYETISVFTSGFGKKKHSRAFYISTQNYVRQGVMDDKLKIAQDVLNGEINELGLLPLLYKIDDEKDAQDPEMWHKANPSLRYFPELQKIMNKEFVSMRYQPEVEQEFFTKRLNWPKGNKDLQVTDWENIIATNQPLPDMTGCDCTVGIDYASVNDMVSVNFHFKKGDQRIDISHAWLCLKSADIPRIRAPWKLWGEQGHLTLVDDVEISPDLIAEYIQEMGQKYNIKCIGLDNYRYALLANSLKKIGFDAKEYKNVYMIRPSDVMRYAPVIQSYFTNQAFVWGENPVIRWATNNTKLVRSGRTAGTDTGNYYFCKIESKSRKNDSFMALVASVIVEDRLDDHAYSICDMPVFIY